MNTIDKLRALHASAQRSIAPPDSHRIEVRLCRGMAQHKRQQLAHLAGSHAVHFRESRPVKKLYGTCVDPGALKKLIFNTARLGIAAAAAIPSRAVLKISFFSAPGSTHVPYSFLTGRDSRK